MKDKFNLNRLYQDYINNEISNDEIHHALLSILDERSSMELLTEALNIIENLSIKDNKIFEIIENLLISDENPKIRSQVATIIVKLYLKEAVSPLKWTIQNEKSSLVINALFDALESIDNDLTRILKKELLKSIFGVKDEDMSFFLELESFSEEFKAINIDFYKNFQTDNISRVKNGDAIYAIKNGHVVALNLNGWKLSFNSLLSKDYNKFRKVLPDFNSLPESITSLEHLEHLDLSYCTMVDTLPQNIGNLKKLRMLSLKESYYLRELPVSIGKLSNLEVLDLSNCLHLEYLPDTIGNLKNLEILDLEGCIKVNQLPDTIGNLKNLEILDLEGCMKLTQLPDSIGNLTKLQHLDLSYCKELKVLPESIKNLSSTKIIQKSNLDLDTPFWVFKRKSYYNK
ncbi:MAG: hypothetical protein ACFFAS_00100 [Promethearchaeota archaeon]